MAEQEGSQKERLFLRLPGSPCSQRHPLPLPPHPARGQGGLGSVVAHRLKARLWLLPLALHGGAVLGFRPRVGLQRGKVPRHLPPLRQCSSNQWRQTSPQSSISGGGGVCRSRIYAAVLLELRRGTAEV